MSTQGCINPNPFRQYILDIIKFVQDSHLKGYEILLMMDANEELGQSSQGTEAILSECGLSNLLKGLHPEEEEPVTYDRGSKTIDYILGSQHIQFSTKKGGILPFYHGIKADHQVLYLDLDANLLFGGKQEDMAISKHRNFISTNPKDSTKYLHAVKTYWRQYNVYKRIEFLESHCSWPKERMSAAWEKIDIDIGRAMALGENAVRKPQGKHAWSKVLRSHAYAFQYWKTRLKCNRLQIQKFSKLEYMRKIAEGNTRPRWSLACEYTCIREGK